MSARDRLRLVTDGPYLPERGAATREAEPTDLSRKPWLSPVEAALYLSLPTVDALRTRIKRGRIPPWCWTKFGGSLRFSRVALDELLAGRTPDARSLRAVASKR